MHPLSPNTTELSDQVLSDKIMELERKLMMSYRTGNSSLINQIQMILEDYRIEHQRRLQKQLESMLEQTGKKLDSIIDIK